MPSTPSHERVRGEIETLFRERGHSLYGGEAVTQLEHALQCASQAKLEQSCPAMIVAALLHDVGHLLHQHGASCAQDGVDDRHEELGAAWLRRRFGSEVSEPIRMHVLAKRFLCSTDPSYEQQLSGPSQLSFRLQGGLLTDEEIQSFRETPYADDAIRLRHWDDAAKRPGLATETLEYFLRLVPETVRHGS